MINSSTSKEKKNAESDTKKFIKNLINNESAVTPKSEEKKENSESDSNESDEKNQKRKSLININMVDNSKSENEEEEFAKTPKKSIKRYLYQ